MILRLLLICDEPETIYTRVPEQYNEEVLANMQRQSFTQTPNIPEKVSRSQEARSRLIVESSRTY